MDTPMMGATIVIPPIVSGRIVRALIMGARMVGVSIIGSPFGGLFSSRGGNYSGF